MAVALAIDSAGDEGQIVGNGNPAAIGEARRDQQRAFEAAAEALALGASAHASDPAPFGGQIRDLEEWARREATLIEDSAIDRLPLVSDSTSEHQVFYRADDGRAVKRTWPGVYGQVPVPDEGSLGRRNATPAEYLRRMALQISVFGSDLKLEGVTVSEKPSMIIGQPSGQASIVISQPWYEKAGVATNEVIHDLMVTEGFRAVPASYFGWYRPDDGVVVVDAKPDNFIATTAGLIPIDLQLAQFSRDELATAGLSSDPTAPVIFIPR
jgi:hypothetical protein